MNESPAAIAVFHEAVAALLRETAEKVVMPRYCALAEHEIEEKAADDFVTIADREAEAMLEEGLGRIIPGLAVVGEEAAFADPSVLKRLSGDCWIVDPIDGTRNFAAGRPPFAIMLAMASGGEAHTGWIYDPVRQRLLVAHKGKGAFLDGERLTVAPSGRPRPNLAAMTKFMAADQRALFETEIVPHYDEVDAPQCSAEQYPLVAFGDHDLAIYERTYAWDHAAGSLFLNEAGGHAARPDGAPYRVDDDRTGMLAATTPALFDEFAERLSRSGYKPGV
jgi:fructose-1,6-bisphosphatase/inositol monophosphatase family enzyme